MLRADDRLVVYEHSLWGVYGLGLGHKDECLEVQSHNPITQSEDPPGQLPGSMCIPGITFARGWVFEKFTFVMRIDPAVQTHIRKEVSSVRNYPDRQLPGSRYHPGKQIVQCFTTSGAGCRA